ncbi:hypothetical protein FOMPIDRAFT_1055587 [Fomitopsis schrenkii]|uniref:Uncharacterized protein n=1 Tax=Fomitopsis schrenkii TaxID=2126942 RepID=S8DRP4_FOMSC|nr:hypothetical protein FOMPIDRAFT_1055587 [Fomitopsis schrenkii]
MANIAQDSDFDLQIPDDWFDLPDPDAQGTSEATVAAKMDQNGSNRSSMQLNMGLHAEDFMRSDGSALPPRVLEQPPESEPLARVQNCSSPASGHQSPAPLSHTRPLSVSPSAGTASGHDTLDMSEDEVEIVVYYPGKGKRKASPILISDEEEHVRNPRFGPPCRIRKRPQRDSRMHAPRSREAGPCPSTSRADGAAIEPVPLTVEPSSITLQATGTEISDFIQPYDPAHDGPIIDFNTILYDPRGPDGTPWQAGFQRQVEWPEYDISGPAPTALLDAVHQQALIQARTECLNSINRAQQHQMRVFRWVLNHYATT